MILSLSQGELDLLPPIIARPSSHMGVVSSASPTASPLSSKGAWLDTGTHDSLAEASTFIEVLEKRQGLKIACLEEIAYVNGWIDRDELLESARLMEKNDHSKYLLRLAGSK